MVRVAGNTTLSPSLQIFGVLSNIIELCLILIRVIFSLPSSEELFKQLTSVYGGQCGSDMEDFHLERNCNWQVIYPTFY